MTATHPERGVTAERGATLPDLFARQAALTPTAVAVRDDRSELSYAELDGLAERVAGALRRRGCDAGSVVGVRLPRGPELVVALLAVWRAGGAYLPLDPADPEERVAAVRAEAGCGLVVTAETMRSCLAEGEDPAVAPVPASPRPAVDPGSPAYVIYTSGSTGRPKGVVVTHGGIANRVAWTVRTHGLSVADRVLQKTAMSFDAAGWEIFAPLVSGGTVVLAPPGAERDAATMLDAVVRHRVTVLQVVPSVLRLLVAEPALAGCGSLRLLFSAGEPLHAELCQRVWAVLPAVELWNTYGPTECAIDVTAHRCDPAETTGPVPIGAPISGARVLVLDDNGDLTPIGLPGELYLGGTGVGLGYVGQPARTAERFVPDPYGPPGSRLYRTGDRGRWRADGTLEYLGRLDDQFKVRGVRIEPAEVETALRAHPGVRACAVLGVPDATGDRRLAAYVVGTGDLTPAVLRGFLRERLPEHLVPTLVVPVPELPLTTSGKVDRTALLALDVSRYLDRPAYRPPATGAERTVAAAWSELLGVEHVGADDDFFQLGGHSLLMTRLAEWLRADTGRQLEVRRLFAAATVREQAELLATGGTEGPAPVAVPRDRRLPLSSGQRRLWFLEQLRRGDPEYIVPLFLRVPAGTPVATVRGALAALAERHEVLRTRYVVRDNEPCQVVDPPGEIELRVVDAGAPAGGAPGRDTSAPGRDASGRDASGGGVVDPFTAELVRGFDLAAGPVWRALLVERPGADGLLLVTAHHIAVDGRSLVVLAGEFERLLAGERLPAPSLQYADHAVWQHRTLSGDLLAEQLGYWRTALAGVRPLELPVDRPRAPERDSRGAVLDFVVPPATARALVERGRRVGATPFMTLLTVFSVLLARYSREWDVVVGTPVSGRTRPEVDAVVGFFLNSLALRPGLDPELTFDEALVRVRDTCTGAFAHGDLPFERLVEEVQPDRDLARTPVYQVIFDLHDAELAATNSRTVDAETMRSIWRTAKTDLTLIMRQHADGTLDGVLEYATALFDEATVRRIAGSFLRLAESLTAEPGRPVGAAELVTDAERALLLGTWNDTAGPQPPAPVHEMIASRAAAVPDAVALVSERGTTTFGDLEARANRLARLLRDRGVGAESVVGVLLDRGPDLVASLLAVWKAGAGYLPLDPAFPAERVGYLLADSGAGTLLTESGLAPLADGFAGTRVLLDADRAAIEDVTGDPLDVAVDLDQLAYVIYTSGSTGRPKGVAVSHRGLANYLLWTVDGYASHGTGRGAPLFSSIAYDLGLPNLYTPLLTGAPVHLFPQEFDLTKLGAMLADAAPFDFVKLAPAQLELVLQQLAGRAPVPLAAVVSAAGDWVPASMGDRWRELTGDPGARFAGEYGPTEITVGNSAYFADPPSPGRSSAGSPEFLSIGRPIPNTTMYVLDEYLNPVPVGVVGEIYVGGVGVARGYVGNPVLTAERFLPDPYGAPGGRLYRTGDLGRVTADGTVEFRGRADNQVKVRGFRVELGAVEAALLAHPEVREAAVVLVDGRLVAYHVGQATGLPAFLAGSLPRHEIPEAFVAMESLPLTTNGKVDRRALPAPGAPAGAYPAGQAPNSIVEQRIADIWSRVLGTRAGVHDNFFDLGGHSMSAAQVMSMIQQEFGVWIGMRVLFDRPTIAGLADAVQELVRTEIERATARDEEWNRVTARDEEWNR